MHDTNVRCPKPECGKIVILPVWKDIPTLSTTPPKKADSDTKNNQRIDLTKAGQPVPMLHFFPHSEMAFRDRCLPVLDIFLAVCVVASSSQPIATEWIGSVVTFNGNYEWVFW